VNWTIKNVKAATACSPCADNERLYFGGSDPFSKGPLVAVSAGATGELVPAEKNGRFDHCAWLQERQGPGMASPLSTGKYVYTNDNNILRCFDAATGEKLYQTRIPGLEMLAASPLLIGDKLLLLDENGRACLVKVGAEFEVVGQGSLDDVFWATPAVSSGAIFLRGVESIYCIRQ
jgi:outer membrane protein assembly factor BamB